MQKQKKKNAFTFAIFLLLLASTIFAIPPIVKAHDPPWKIPTTAYMNISPNPVGVGQTVFVVVWLDRTPSGTSVSNDIRFMNYQLTIIKPDGTEDHYTWPVVTDTTSSAYTTYTPQQVGNYSVRFDFPGQVFTWSGAYQNDTFNPSSRTLPLVVQQEELPNPVTSYPLPSEYWTRPIEGQNTDWFSISSNWLGSGSPNLSGLLRKIQTDGTAPNSEHIMWTKPISDGGVVGGSHVGVDGNTFYPGLTYNRRFGAQIIMYDRLFYQEPLGNSGSGGDYVAVDLRTGKELWRTNTTGIGVPSFGYFYDMETANQHGVLPEGLLFTSNFARAYDPSTGRVTTMNITNVPTAAASNLGPKGEHLRYVWNYAARTLAQWNSSKALGYQSGTGVGGWYSGTIPANAPITPVPSGTNNNWNGSMWVTSTVRAAQGYSVAISTPAYDWNVSIPDLNGLASASVISAKYGDMIFGRSSSFVGSIAPSSFGTPDPYTLWALNLKPGQEGKLLWIKNYTAPPNNVTVLQGTVDFDTRIFTLYIKESMQWFGYSLDDGSQVWGPTPRPLSDFDYYEPDTTAVAAFGKFFYSNYGGICYAYDGKTGELLWTYGNGGPGNTTDNGFGGAWGRTPIQPEVLADGKIYLTSTEHSPNAPLYKNSRLICLNITNGDELWSILNYGGTYGGFGPQAAVADGYLVTLNHYDYQIYCYGKGPSSMTVTAPDAGIEVGKSIVIRGTLMDIAEGSKQPEQAARFPNGLAIVSDDSMAQWMEYVYMQKPRPADTTGVPVTVSVLDANGNYRTIGETTSDSDGFFSFDWKPDIEGKYTVYASFIGSESYWPSHAVTSFAADAAPTSPTPTRAPEPLTVETYFVPAIAGLFVLIILVAVVLGLLMLRKRP